MEAAKKVRRIAYLTAGAEIYGNSVQLHYRRRGFSSLSSGPPITVCPPIKKLKKGTKVRLTIVGQPGLEYSRDVILGKITKVALVAGIIDDRSKNQPNLP